MVERVVAAQSEVAKKFAERQPFTSASVRHLAEIWSSIDRGANSPDQQTQQGAYALMDQIKKELPSQRATEALILSLDPKVIADLPAGETLLADKPTRMELPLPRIDPSILRQLAEDQQTWIQNFHRDASFDNRHSWFTVDPRLYTLPLDPKSTRIVLIARRDQPDSTPSFSAYFLNAEGSIVTFGETNMSDPKRIPPKPTPAKPFEPRDIVFSPETALSSRPLS